MSETKRAVHAMKGIKGPGNSHNANVTNNGSNPAGSEGSKSPGPEKNKPPVIKGRSL